MTLMLSQQSRERIADAWKRLGKLSLVVEFTGYSTGQCSKHKPHSIRVKESKQAFKEPPPKKYMRTIATKPFKINLAVGGEYADALGNIRRITGLSETNVEYLITYSSKTTRKVGARGECAIGNFRVWAKKKVNP